MQIRPPVPMLKSTADHTVHCLESAPQVRKQNESLDAIRSKSDLVVYHVDRDNDSVNDKTVSNLFNKMRRAYHTATKS